MGLSAVDHRGRILGGRYQLLKRIGGGDYGDVYRAKQLGTSRLCAVKVLRHRVSQRRLWGEHDALAMVNHNDAVKVIDARVEPDGTMWIAMHLVEGVTLRDWLDKHGPMSMSKVVPMMTRIVGAVSKAHEAGVVHRDLKTDNIIVSKELAPTVLDFGIAKWIGDDGRDLLLGSSEGAFGYRAPEWWDDPRNVGPASDIYAIGIIAYECLTGRRPFDAHSREEWKRLHQTAPIPEIGLGLPVYRAVAGALSKTPDTRSSADIFVDELRGALAASEPEVRNALAHHWDASGRPSDPVKALAAAMRRSIAQDNLLNAAYQKAYRRTEQLRWWKVIAVTSALIGAIGWYRSHKNDEASAALMTQAEVEQGRQDLLLANTGRAAEHLRKAHELGDRSGSIEFMLDRAREPQRAELARLPAIKGRAWSVALSPDGSQIVTTDEGGAQLWDARTYKRLHVLPHADVVYDAAFTSDGARLITACGDGAVRIWTAADGKLVRELRANRHARFAKLAVHGDAIAAMHYDGANTSVWNAATGEVVAAVHSKSGTLWSIEFSASGQWLAANVGDEVHVLNTTTWHELDLPPRAARSLAWSPTEDHLAIGAPSGDVSIWGVDGRRLAHLREIGSPVDIVVFSPDGSRIGTADLDGTIRLWDSASGRQRSQAARANRVRSLVFNATSDLMAAGGQDGSVAAFDAVTGLQLAKLDGAKDGVWSLRFDRQRLIAASWSGAAHVWDARSQHRVWVTDATADACGVLTSTVADRRFVAVGCEGYSTRVWDTAERKLLATLPPMSGPDGDWTPVLPVVSDDGARAAIARGNAAEVYELPGGRLLRTIVHGAAVSAVAFGHDRDLVSGATDGTIQLTHDGQQPSSLPAAPAGIDAVGVMPDGRVLATDAANHLRVISSSGVEVLDAPTRITLLRPSPDGWLVTLPGATIPNLGGRADPAVLWDLRTHRARPVGELRGNLGRVVAARWTSAGPITVGADGTVRLWGTNGHLVRDYQVLRQHLLVDAAVSPDGHLLVAGGADGLVEFWDFATGRELWSLRAHVSQVTGLHFEGADLITRGFGGELARWHFGPAVSTDRGMVQP